MSSETPTPASAQPVLLITGASTGIGAATAHLAAAEGYRLVLAARSRERLEKLAAELDGPEHALAVVCDVTEWEDQQRMVAATLEAFGRIDVAFANAGFGGARGFLNDTPEHWKEMILTNVYGTALTLRATIPALKESRGHLLLTSSVAGRRVLPDRCIRAPSTRHRDGRGRPPGSARQRRASDRDRAGNDRHPLLREPPHRPPGGADIARGVLYAIAQPPHVNVNEVLIRPTAQRKDGLLEETVGEELLLYDRDSHTAHCLSPIVACIWRHCDGERDMAELAELAGASENLVADALHELREKDLLAVEPQLMQRTVPGISRREAIARGVRYGAAATAVPLIVSATAATPAMASSAKPSQDVRS